MPDIVIKNLTKKYGEHTVYDGFDITFKDGTVTALLGRSGCGKTTLLNVLSGLTPFEGQITGVPEHIGYIFQEARLVPSLTALGNLMYVGVDKNRATKMLDEVGVAPSLYPSQMSGGMAQRVSMARAFALFPPLMLMDEPFKDLDVKLKEELKELFKTLHKQNPATVIMVTHDISEAETFASRAVVLSSGKIILDTLSAPAVSQKIKTALMSE